MVPPCVHFVGPSVARLGARQGGFHLEHRCRPTAGRADAPKDSSRASQPVQGASFLLPGGACVKIMNDRTMYLAQVLRAHTCTSLYQVVMRHLRSGDLFLVANTHTVAGKTTHAIPGKSPKARTSFKEVCMQNVMEQCMALAASQGQCHVVVAGDEHGGLQCGQGHARTAGGRGLVVGWRREAGLHSLHMCVVACQGGRSGSRQAAQRSGGAIAANPRAGEVDLKLGQP